MPSSSQPVRSRRPSLLPGLLGFGLALVLIGLGSAAMFWVTPVNPPPSSVLQAAPTPAVPEPVPSSPPTPAVPAPPVPATLAPSTLSLEVRQNIYKLLSSEEDKTIRAANARFPGGGAEFQQYLDTQTQVYQKRIAAENSTTAGIVEGISLEGLTQGWNTQ